MAKGALRIHRIDREDNALVIHWQDDHQSRFHHIWLRHQCECAQCGTPVDGIRNVWLTDLENNPAIDQISLTDESVDVVWRQDNHRSVYRYGWLRANCYCEKSRHARRHRPTLWDARAVKPLPPFDLDQVSGDKELRLQLLETVRDLGFCRLSNMNTALEGIQQAAALFGPVRMTHYGISDINEKSAQYNVGDSGRPLLPHTDESYRISSVAITLFQVVQPSQSGGHSTLVDGFEVARRLRNEDPRAFELLTTVPVTFQRHHTGESLDGNHRYLVSRFPVIKVDDAGEVIGVRINERQISPLLVSDDLVEPFYRALRRLFAIAYDDSLRIELALKSGEGMVFDNQRILHGRTAFTRGDIPRHVRTCTVDTEEFHSTLRLLQMELDKPGADLFMHQGM